MAGSYFRVLDSDFVGRETRDLLAGSGKGKNMRLLPLVLVLAVGLAACGSTPVDEPEPVRPVAVINLTSGPDDLHRAWMGFKLADHFAAYGHRVIVFLNVEAPSFASTSLPADLAYEDKPAFATMVRELIAKDVAILVCPDCAMKKGVAEGDLVEGAALASRDSLFGPLNDRTVVFTY